MKKHEQKESIYVITFVNMKVFSLTFMFFCFLSFGKIHAQNFKKIVDIDCKRSDEKDIRMVSADDGIFFETKVDRENHEVKFISSNGNVVYGLPYGEAYSSDSSMFCIASVAYGRIGINIYPRNDTRKVKTLLTTKTVVEIFDDNGLILPKDEHGKYKFTPYIKNVFLFGKTIFIILRNQMDITFFDSYFLINTDSADDITKIDPEFPKLNDEDPPNKRAWVFIDYKRETDRLIFSREYILRDGPYKGQHSFAVSIFNSKFDFIKKIELCAKPDNDLSLEYLTNELIWHKPSGSFLVSSYVKSATKINKSNYGFLIRSVAIDGKQNWNRYEWDEIFENYYTIKDQADFFLDYANNSLLYKFNYALVKHRYQYDLKDGALLMKEEKSQLIIDKAKDETGNAMKQEIERLMNGNLYSSYEIFPCGNKFLILFKNKLKRYSFYVN